MRKMQVATKTRILTIQQQIEAKELELASLKQALAEEKKNFTSERLLSPEWTAKGQPVDRFKAFFESDSKQNTPVDLELQTH